MLSSILDGAGMNPEVYAIVSVYIRSIICGETNTTRDHISYKKGMTQEQEKSKKQEARKTEKLGRRLGIFVGYCAGGKRKNCEETS